MASSPHIFGVRHLSPAASWDLIQLLERVRPTLVLIEGADDADRLIPDMVSGESRLPIAVLAYTADAPVRTFAYPLAVYSPEYQALRWCHENGVEVRFMDLPSSVFLGLMDRDDGAGIAEKEVGGEQGRSGGPKESPTLAERIRGELEDEVEESQGVVEKPRGCGSVYERVAEMAGEPDYETYWERHFEQLDVPGSYREASLVYGEQLRELENFDTRHAVENLVREAYMRRKMRQAVAEGFDPGRMVVVTGAFHAPVLNLELPAMTDAELLRLRRRESKLTLMPYSFFKLSTQSGYGAGNHAPAYFEMLWNSRCEGLGEGLPVLFLTRVARELRAAGTFRSTAEVIEGVRLAEAMASLRGSVPTLRELRDAAVTLLGQGDAAVVRESLLRVEVGTAIGSLAKGVSQTSIQDDFNRELGRLKLEPFKTGVKRELDLDLRENRRVKTEEAAYLDLNRSRLLHRLEVLGVGFGRKVGVRQEGTNWAERWVMQWTPEAEMAIVEAVLLGETIELAVSFKFKRQLEVCESVAEASGVIRQACECGLSGSVELARQTLQRLGSDSSDFGALAAATHELGMVIRYGDVRKFDAEPLKPLLQQLFLSGVLAMAGASHGDAAAARRVVAGMDDLNKVALDYATLVEELVWLAELQKLARADHFQPMISGYACALLVERNVISNEELSREVSRRLSPGIPADVGAGWFEGLSQRNRYALLTRLVLWEQLAGYVASLGDEEFKRALVFLRRTFGEFSPQEKQSICENLGEVWGVNADAVGEILSGELDEKEKKKIDELSDFNFEDL